MCNGKKSRVLGCREWCAADRSSLVIAVLDRDIDEGFHNPYPECIRLNGIDCTENGQA